MNFRFSEEETNRCIDKHCRLKVLPADALLYGDDGCQVERTRAHESAFYTLQRPTDARVNVDLCEMCVTLTKCFQSFISCK